MPTVPTVAATMTIRELFIIPQKLGVLRIEMILAQLGGLGMEYGWAYICPVVFTLPKSRSTMGTNIMMVAVIKKT